MSALPEHLPSPSTDLALQWAADVAHNPELREESPGRPTAAQWREMAVPEVRAQLDRLLLGRHVEFGLNALHEIGCLDAWLPEVASMVGFGDSEWRHKDVWAHTCQVVKQSVPRLEVRWGALLHDIGKPKTRRIDARGKVTFYGHAEVGASMFRKRMADRLEFDEPLRERIHFLILYHLRASRYDESWTDSAVRRFYRQMDEGLRDLLDLSRADITTKRPEKRKRGVRQISLLAKHIDKLKDEDLKIAPLPKGIGQLIIDAFEIPPSKRVGELRDTLEELVDSGELPGGEDGEFYVEWLKQNRERFSL